MDQSTQGGSGVCEYPFRDTFQADDKNTCIELIHMEGLSSKFMISFVFCVQWGFYCEWKKFPESLNEVQIKKSGVVFTIKAFVRLVPGWVFDYPDADSGSCNNWKPYNKYKMICKYSNSKSGCV